MSFSASFTSSNLNGLMMPTISFTSAFPFSSDSTSDPVVGVGGLGVLVEVEPLLLLLRIDPGATRQHPVEHQEDDEAHHEGEHHHRARRESLPSEEPQAATVEQPVATGSGHGRIREQPEEERADETADEVHTHDVE